ncbi:helix-turn-helix transcriptional regulator [Natrialbaceae archaeon A-gly3]
MDAALEEIEFLALSENRVEVLDAVREDARTRRELEGLTGASQPTLGRILRDFGDRNWVRRCEDGYEATATGRLVAEGIVDLREIVETELELRRVVEWLPTEEMDFDLRRLQGATITVPTGTRPSAPVGRSIEVVQEAEDVRSVSHAFNDRSLDLLRRRTTAGEATFEGVLSEGAIDAIRDDEVLCRRFRELLTTENGTIRIYEGEVPLAVTIADDVVSLLLRDEEGRLQAALDTDDEVVREWAEDVYERYREGSRHLEVAELEEAG